MIIIINSVVERIVLYRFGGGGDGLGRKGAPALGNELGMSDNEGLCDT